MGFDRFIEFKFLDFKTKINEFQMQMQKLGKN